VLGLVRQLLLLAVFLCGFVQVCAGHFAVSSQKIASGGVAENLSDQETFFAPQVTADEWLACELELQLASGRPFWLSPDPAGFVDGPNLYAYVRNNPWSAFDPHGLEMEIFHPDGRHATVPDNTSVFVWTDRNGQTQMAAISRDPTGKLYYDTSGKIEAHRRAMGAKRFGEQMAAGGYTLATLLPVIGEGDDVATVADESNPGWVRSVAGISLTISGVTYGFSPNFGKWAKSLSDIFGGSKHADEIVDSADEVFGMVDVGGSTRSYADLGEAATPGGFSSESTRYSAMINHMEAGYDFPMPVMLRDEPIRLTIANISAITGKEVGLLRLKNGSRVLRLGQVDELGHFISSEGVSRMIAHTHPSRNLAFSQQDIILMEEFKARSSVLIDPVDGFAVRMSRQEWYLWELDDMLEY